MTKPLMPEINKQESDLVLNGRKVNPYPNRRIRRHMAKQNKIVKDGLWKPYNERVKATSDGKTK